MSRAAVACLALLLLPMAPPAAAQSSGSVCTPVGPCFPLQRQYDDLVGNNLRVIGGANVGWLNLQPGNLRFEPLLDFPERLVTRTLGYAQDMGALVQAAAAAAQRDTDANAGEVSTWMLGVVGVLPGQANASALAIANAGDATLVVTVSQAGAWVSFVNAAGVTLSSTALTFAQTAPASTGATAARAAAGGPDYADRKAKEAAERILLFLADPPAHAVQPDSDENGLGDRWEEAVCGARLGALPAGACQTVNGAYRMGRSYATLDFDQDGLDLLDEYRWNSDPTAPDTDLDGLPDGPEADTWRRAENDLVVQANLWNCPAGDPGFASVRSCSWRHPDSFRDDDGDGLPNMGQNPAGVLAHLGAGDADSEGDGLREGDEHYGCWTDPAYGANPHPDPRIPEFEVCDGRVTRGHASDPAEPDTDEDGLPDAQEVCSATGGACSRMASYGTDPQAPDSDGDGWNDGPEAAFWKGHGGWWNNLDRDPILNNLADPDSDRDGIQDGMEMLPSLQTWPHLPDSDGDTMPDQWEVRNGFDPRNPADGGPCVSTGADADSDGLCNAFEYAFGRPEGWVEAYDGEWRSVLNPRSADMDNDRLPDGAEVFPQPALEQAWRHAQQQPTAADPLGTRYYARDAAYPGYPGSTRIDLSDTDGDGLTDFLEETQPSSFGTYTNPNAADSDADGLADGQELRSDPAHWDTDRDGTGDAGEGADCVAQSDCDNDQLADSEEEARGCKKGNPDSDGDGLLDGWEVHGTTPGDANGRRTRCDRDDSDGDTLNDAEEILTYAIDPNRKDSDEDGLEDQQEIAGTLNAAHSANHQTRGRYSFGSDRCASEVPRRCANPGATDPGVADSDRDGLSDGNEVLGVYKSSQCATGPFCPHWFLNPNQADTDGDNPPGSTRFTDAGERFRVSTFDNPYGTPYDPTDFDPDRDLLPDARENELGTNPFGWDTDRDLLGDGAEAMDGGFGSDPRKASTDIDSLPDLYDPELHFDNDPPVLLGWSALGGDVRRGVCLAVADQQPEILVTKVARKVVTVVTNFDTGEQRRTAVWDNSTLVPHWDDAVDPPMLCVDYFLPECPGCGSQFRQHIERVEVVLHDAVGNPLWLGFDLSEHGPSVTGWQLLEQMACWVPFAGPGVSIVKALSQDKGITAVWGLVELTENFWDKLQIRGKYISKGMTVVKTVGTTLCLAENAKFLAEAKESIRYEAALQVEADPRHVHTFQLQGGGQAYLKVVGFEDHRTLVSGVPVWRGDGYTYLMAKFADRGWTLEQWREKLGHVLKNGAYSEDCAGTTRCYKVFQATHEGLAWKVYVHKGAVVDVHLKPPS